MSIRDRIDFRITLPDIEKDVYFLIENVNLKVCFVLELFVLVKKKKHPNFYRKVGRFKVVVENISVDEKVQVVP